LMEEKREQKTLFDLPPEWAEHWEGMPEYR
jgi:hypothetical protein